MAADGPTDPLVRVVKIASGAQTLGFIAHHACHPVVMGPESFLISSDFVGGAVNKVSRDLGGAVGLFIQGASGDINPVFVCLAQDEALPRVEELSKSFASNIVDALNKTEPLEVGPLCTTRRDIELPLVVPDREEILNILDALERWSARTDVPSDLLSELRFFTDAYHAVLKRFERTPLDRLFTEIQAFRAFHARTCSLPIE